MEILVGIAIGLGIGYYLSKKNLVEMVIGDVKGFFAKVKKVFSKDEEKK